jgi:hypothetical protein
MPSKLPSIEMPQNEVQPSQIPAGRPPAPPAELMIHNLIEDLVERSDLEEGEIVTIDPRPKFEEEEVFNPTKEQVVPEVPEVQELNSEIGEVPDKKGRRKYQRKGEMSDKQKAHLERIRAKALENKKKRKEENEALDKEKALALEEKREQKRLEQEQKKQEQEVQRQSKEAERLASAMTANMYSKQDLELAMVNAIAQYDGHRKAQKAEKKKKQAEEAQRAQQTRLIQQAINPQPTTDQWRQYFS